MTELEPLPVIFAVIVISLAITSINVNSPITRLKIGEIALLFLVLFFHSLLKSDIDELRKKIEDKVVDE